jgi:hypothetical protein
MKAPAFHAAVLSTDTSVRDVNLATGTKWGLLHVPSRRRSDVRTAGASTRSRSGLVSPVIDVDALQTCGFIR